MKYNDNGTYKDIYVKAFDTLPIGTEVDYDGSVVPDGWAEVEVESGEITYETSSQFQGDASYVKYGRIVQLQAWIVIKQTITTPWTSLLIAKLPDNIKPLKSFSVSAARDVDRRIYTVSVGTNGNLSLSDRGAGNITANSDGIIVSMTYISAE